MTINMLWVWLFILGDGAVWVLAGFLTAAGDTRWVMISNMISVSVFCLLPVYALILTGWLQANAWALWLPSAFYGFGNVALMAWRYKSGGWKTINLVSGVQAAQHG
jgi:MATE family multidrug resistance protein